MSEEGKLLQNMLRRIGTSDESGKVIIKVKRKSK